jgi:hypothetical protein
MSIARVPILLRGGTDRGIIEPGRARVTVGGEIAAGFVATEYSTRARAVVLFWISY